MAPYKDGRMSQDLDPAVVAEGLFASYGAGRLRVSVLANATFEVPRGHVTAITGPSGSGKTTLLSIIGGLDRPEAGRLLVDGEDVSTLDLRGLERFRRRRVGFVFQSFNLLPSLTARENVAAGLEPLGRGRRDARRRTDEALDAVGLLALGHRFPHQLSGGEQQRVAVARACAKDPPLLLADEPTGNLDEEAGQQVLDLLLGETAAAGARTVIVVTHDPLVAARAHARLALRKRQVHSV